MHRYGITLLAAIGAVVAVLAARPAVISEAGADSCCSGPYVTGVIMGGGGFIGDIRSVGPVTGNLKDDSAQDSVGGGGGAFGFNWKRLGAPIRTEIEYAQMIRLDWDSRQIFTSSLPTVGFSNNVNTTTIMLNALYDFDVGSSWWRPYGGFGIGYARNSTESKYNDLSLGGDSVRREKFKTGNLAWSLMAGGNFDITENWFAEAAYRFINTGSVEAGNSAAGVHVDADTIYRHELRLGFGYRF